MFREKWTKTALEVLVVTDPGLEDRFNLNIESSSGPQTHPSSVDVSPSAEAKT